METKTVWRTEMDEKNEIVPLGWFGKDIAMEDSGCYSTTICSGGLDRERAQSVLRKSV